MGGGVFLCFTGLVVLALIVVAAGGGFGTADLQGATHEVFAVEFGDGATSFFDGAHGDKGEAFGALGAVVDDDFGVTDIADAVEEFEQVAFRCVVGEIADVEAI